MKIKDRTASYQTKNINIRVSPYLHTMLEVIARDNHTTLSNVVKTAINEKYLKSYNRSKK